MSKMFGLLLILAVLVIAAPGRVQARSQVVPKRITISLSRQRLRAWDGNRVVLVTQVTTGNRWVLPTPTGWFHIYRKYSPFEFISPWPYGSRFWYPPSWVRYSMEFLPGYYIHDAPWRSVYGPASQRDEDPGTNYGGSHGCVNVPFSAEQFLWNWAPIGTPVHIVR